MADLIDLFGALADRLYPWKPLTDDIPVPHGTIGPVSYAKNVPEPLGEQFIFEGRRGQKIWEKLKKSADLPDGPFEVLGKGTRGTAYAVDEKRVLKVTADRSEAVGAASVRDNPDQAGRAQNILSVWELRRPGQRAWAIMQERLQQLDEEDPWADFADLWPPWTRANDYVPIWPEHVQQFIDDVEQENLVEPSDSEWRKFKEWFVLLAEYFKTIELRYHDFWHRNLLRRGLIEPTQHVAIDFGYSTSDAEPPPDIEVISRFLARAQRRALLNIVKLVVSADDLEPNDFERDYDDLIEDRRVPKKHDTKTIALPHPIAQEVGGPIQKKIMQHLGMPEKSFGDFRRLGVGQNGIAFLLPDLRVLKITKDTSEAHASIRLVGKHNETIVEILDVFEFRTVNDKPLYGIVQERLQKPDADWVEFAGEWWEFRADPNLRKKFHDWFETPITKKNIELFRQWLGHQGRTVDEEKFNWLGMTAKELRGLGVQFRDLHNGNIMKRSDGSHVIIDLGASKSAPATIPMVSKVKAP